MTWAFMPQVCLRQAYQTQEHPQPNLYTEGVRRPGFCNQAGCWGKSLILTELQFARLQKDVIKSDDLQRLSVLTVRESMKLLYGNHKGTWVINSGIEEVFLLLREIISKKL